MKILAVDPGYELTAWCVVQDERPVLWGKEPNEQMLQRLRDSDRFESHVLAVEMIASYGMPVGKEVFDTCLWIGRYVEAWASRGGEHRLVYRRDVKLCHCGSVRATDANIRAALIDRFGPGKAKAVGIKSAPGPLYGLKGDEWSALAVGLTAIQSVPQNALGAT